MRISDWSSDVCSSDLLGAERVELVGHRGDAPVEALLHLSTLRLDVLEHGLGRAQRQRMADERAGKIGHAYGWHRIVAKLPVSAVDRNHVFAHARDHADLIAATTHFAIGSQIGLDTKPDLGAGRAPAETGHNPF